MALPTCACVASLPPMQRWAAIAAMAQTWAGSTVTPITCARTFNEILNDLYCALYSVVQDGPASTPPELLSATIDETGEILTLVFSEAVNGFDGFTLNASGGAVTLTYSSGDGTTTLVFDLSRVVEEGETVTLDYTPGDVENLDGVALEAFSGAAVTNDSIVHSTIEIDALLDIESGTEDELITAAALNTADLGDAWTWAVSRTPMQHTHIVSGGRDYGSLTVTVGGIPVPSGANRSLEFNLEEAFVNNSSPIFESCEATPPSGVEKLVVSGWVYFGATKTQEATVGLDCWSIGGTPYLVLQQEIGGGSPSGTAGIIRVETQRDGGVTVKSTPIAVDIGWHFCELYWDGGTGEMTLLVRDADMEFVGTSSFISNDAAGGSVAYLYLQSYLNPQGGLTLHDKVGRNWKEANFNFPLFPLTLETPVVSREQTDAGDVVISWPSKAVSYAIEQSSNGGVSWTTLQTSISTFDLANAVPGQNTYTVTGLTNGSAYRWRVRAFVGSVSSAWGSSTDLTIYDAPFLGAWQETISPASTDTDSDSNPFALIAKLTISGGGTASRIGVYSGTLRQADGPIKLVVYNASLEKIGQVTVAVGSGEESWTDAFLDDEIAGLTNGQVVWLGFLAEQDNRYRFRYLNGGASNTGYDEPPGGYAAFPTDPFASEGLLTRTYAARLYVYTP